MMLGFDGLLAMGARLLDGLQAMDPWAGQLLASLGRQMLYAAVVALVVALPAWWLRRRAPDVSHGLWSLVLVRLVLPPDVASSLSLRALGQRLWPTETLATPTLSSSGPMEALAWPASSPAVSSVLAENGVWGSLTVLLWLQLAVLLFAWGFWRRKRYERLMQTPIQDAAVLERLETWRRRLGLRRSVQLWTGPENHVPFTLGLWRPRIFLPGRLLPSSVAVNDAAPGHDNTPSQTERLEAVLGHELAHIAHGDDAWLHGQRLLLALYLFFPPLWWACARMHDARERLADTLALQTGLVSPRNYALTLLHVHQMQLNRPRAVSAFGLDPRRLVLRIRTILDHDVAVTPSSVEDAQPVQLSRRGLPWVLLVGLILLPMATVHQVSGDGAGGDRPELVAALGDAADSPQNQDGSSEEGADQAKASPRFVHPLPGARLTASFGPWKSPFKDHPDHHNGLDLASPRGTLIVAPADGVVTAATQDPAKVGDYGVVLYLEHDGELETVFAHLDNVLVDEGDQVEAGQPIATVGLTGKTTGPHLHFEVRRGGELVDPASLLDDDC